MSASTLPPTSEEALSRGTILHSQRASAQLQWGDEGVKAVLERLSPETRDATAGPALTPLGWYPTRYSVEWVEAVHDGPARRDEQAVREWVDRAIDMSFGRVRRVFLRLATPTLLAQRAAELWRREHTHGVLEMESDVSARAARLTLRDHPYTTTFASRIVTSEIFRYVLSLSKARNVRESHALQEGILKVSLLWG